MREIYPLTNDTRAVLTDNVIAIANEMDVHTSYLYQILSNAACDPFAKFRRLYAAAVRAGVDVSPWDGTLASIRNKHSQKKSSSECLIDKIDSNADTTRSVVDALKDGVISPSEADRIHKAITKERNALDALEAMVNLSHQDSDIRRWAKNRVANR